MNGEKNVGSFFQVHGEWVLGLDEKEITPYITLLFFPAAKKNVRFIARLANEEIYANTLEISNEDRILQGESHKGKKSSQKPPVSLSWQNSRLTRTEQQQATKKANSSSIIWCWRLCNYTDLLLLYEQSEPETDWIFLETQSGSISWHGMHNASLLASYLWSRLCTSSFWILNVAIWRWSLASLYLHYDLDIQSFGWPSPKLLWDIPLPPRPRFAFSAAYHSYGGIRGHRCALGIAEP